MTFQKIIIGKAMLSKIFSDAAIAIDLGVSSPKMMCIEVISENASANEIV